MPFLIKMIVKISKRGLLHITSDCDADRVATILAVACVGEFDWAATDFVGQFLYHLTDAANIFVSEWQTEGFKRGLCCDAVPRVVYMKVALRYLKEICNVSKSREFPKAVWDCYKADETDIKKIPSLLEQRAFVQFLDTECTSDLLKGIDDKKINGDSKGIVTAEGMTTSGFRRKLW